MTIFASKGRLTPEGDKVKAYMEAQIAAAATSGATLSGTLRTYQAMTESGAVTPPVFFERYANAAEAMWRLAQAEQAHAESAPSGTAKGVEQALQALQEDLKAVKAQLAQLAELTALKESQQTPPPDDKDKGKGKGKGKGDDAPPAE